jgi:uncharacterized protein YbjQ (UPF0145 family)
MSDALAQIPQSAGARLADAASGKCFSSDLSVNEFLLVGETGFEPLGMVLGSSVYHVGLQVGRWNTSMELTTLTQALYNARELAMGRMQSEAERAGATGIVGVRLEKNNHVWGEHAVEFLAVGTAVRSFEVDTPPPTPGFVLPITG